MEHGTWNKTALPFFIMCSMLYVMCIDFVNASFHIKILFWHIVMLAFQNFRKTLNCVFKFDKLSFNSRKSFGNIKWLTHKPLYFSRPADHFFVVFRQFFHSQNGNNVLQIFVSLQS